MQLTAASLVRCICNAVQTDAQSKSYTGILLPEHTVQAVNFHCSVLPTEAGGDKQMERKRVRSLTIKNL